MRLNACAFIGCFVHMRLVPEHIYQLPFMLTAVLHVHLINIVYLTVSLSHCMYLYQVNLTLHFLNDLDDVKSTRESIIINAFIIAILKSEPIINELQTIFYMVNKRKTNIIFK